MDVFVANTSKLLTLEREAERAESDDVAAVPLRVKELIERHGHVAEVDPRQLVFKMEGHLGEGLGCC